MTNKEYLSVAEIARQITIMCTVDQKDRHKAQDAATDFGRIICTNYGSDAIAMDTAMANLPLALKSAFLKGYQEMAEKVMTLRIAEVEAEINRFEHERANGFVSAIA